MGYKKGYNRMLEDDLNQNKASNQSIENDKEKKNIDKMWGS